MTEQEMMDWIDKQPYVRASEEVAICSFWRPFLQERPCS